MEGKTSEPETLEQRSRRVAKLLRDQDDDYAAETIDLLLHQIDSADFAIDRAVEELEKHAGAR